MKTANTGPCSYCNEPGSAKDNIGRNRVYVCTTPDCQIQWEEDMREYEAEVREDAAHRY